MRRTPTERRTALTTMPRADRGRTMLRLGLRMKAIGHDKADLTAGQRHRLDTELRPVIERIQTAQQATNLADLTAALTQQADTIFTNIFGADWAPRPDNPVERECRQDLGVSLTDI